MLVLTRFILPDFGDTYWEALVPAKGHSPFTPAIKKLKLLWKRVCFHCREPGHGVADCPAVLESQDTGTGICYRCGSTEHDISKCRAKVDPAVGPFPYAKCFICGEMGHLSRSCPDNPKGLYAEGGGCRLCGSVEHFKKDCPEKQNSDQVTVGRWATGMSADYEEISETPKLQKPKVKEPKVVTF
ncbi:zinc finger CCHC domain-containing protein 9 [Egretta garzetta]|nr:zinc finger CCHC domain-containing protein 9 [Egretta garzetta]